MKRLFLGVLIVLVFGSATAQKAVKIKETKVKEMTEAERMAWWEEARFGMFIHWGIYSVPAGFYKGVAQTNSGEWIMNKGKIPRAEYEKFAAEFNPTKFNAKEFVALAKEAGMKYMVITAKHHDGFSMFGSKASKFNIVDATPFKRDVLKELAKECQAQGIKFGFYYSQAQDWNHPGGLGNTWDTFKRVSTDEYVYQKALPEVKQLLTEYGPIAVFWWDTPRDMTKAVIDSLHHITRALQPKIITNDRLGDAYPGDHKTFERNGPRYQPEAKYWELCKPISGSWGYRSDDNNFNSVKTLLHDLIDQSSKGGNFLLNVSPTNEGILRPEATERMQEIGVWMKKNSEAIYGTHASPTSTEPEWGRITMKTVNNKGLLYLHVYDWKNGTSIPVRLKNSVEACYLLTDTKRIFTTKTSADGIQVQLTGEAPDAVASVIVLKLKEMPNAIPQSPLGQDNSGVVILPAVRAQYENLQGPGALYDDHLDCVGSWDSETARVYWSFNIDKPGTFEFSGDYTALENSEIKLTFNGETKSIKIPSTGDNPKRFKNIALGSFTVDKSGKYEVSFMPDAKNWKAIALKEVKLKPSKK